MSRLHNLIGSLEERAVDLAFAEKGACVDHPEGNTLFFPESGESPDAAKAICATCPVEDRCLEYALKWREDFGVWGGKSQTERRRIRKQAKRTEWQERYDTDAA